MGVALEKAKRQKKKKKKKKKRNETKTDFERSFMLSLGAFPSSLGSLPIEKSQMCHLIIDLAKNTTIVYLFI